MAITNFIPTVWSENLSSALETKYVAVSHCNRDYEGDIKNMGSVVKICGIGHVSINNYVKNSNMVGPQSVDDTVTELVIDQAKYFNFQIDDIDKTQCTPKLMDAAMKNAANALANEADKYVFSFAKQAAINLSVNNPAPSDLISKIIEARRYLYENNVSEDEEVVLEIAPRVAATLLTDLIALSNSKGDELDPGCLGTVAGCKVYVSNNIPLNIDDSSYSCLMRTKRAIAFAEQLSEIEAYRPQQRFADAVKGLHLYGAKVIYPEEMVCLSVIYGN